MDKYKIIEIIASNIRLERLRKKYTQDLLSEKAGITQKYLNLIENKKVNPSIVIVVKICNALGIDLNTLMNE